MIDKIKELEKISKLLEPSSEQRNSMLEKVIRYSEDFLNSLSSSKTYNDSNDSDKEISKFSANINNPALVSAISKFPFLIHK